MPNSPAVDARPVIEDKLASFFGRKYCVLTNRGTTSLAAAFFALDRPKGTRALFPAVMCSIPVFAAGFAGWTPAFADVNGSDSNFDLGDVERVLKSGGVGAVVPVHMFGKPDDVDGLEELCRRYGADLVEDAALSMGAVYRGRPVGSLGRISCLSFVRKMLPLEMGGAVLTDEPGLAARVRVFVAGLPPERSSRRDEVAAAMKAFHSVTGFVAAGDWARRDLLAPYGDEFRRLLLGSTSEEDWRDSIVLEELAALPDALQARRARAEVFEDGLGESLIQPLDRSGSSLFAYPVRLPGVSVEDFMAFSSNRGYTFKRIAYPDIHPIFGPRQRFPNAETLEREVIGLPLDDDQPVSAFWEYASDFRTAVEDFAKGAPSRRPFDFRGKLELRMGGV
jgi:dTDP-4-amino-4,6-dideoxygalactose transaminase